MKYRNKQGVLQRGPYGRIKLYVPVKNLIEKLTTLGFIKNNKGKYFGPWINLSDYEIVMKYKSILMGYRNYYYLADREWDIDIIKYYLTYSVLHTLAAKHRISLAKAFKKYGK
jgi:hypothetical protein